MGCSNSKLHTLPAVSLCRDRRKFIAEALHHINALAAAHVAYLQSFDSLTTSLNSFLHHNSIRRRLQCQTHGGDDLKPPPLAAVVEHPSFSSSSSSSESSPNNSHLHFDSDSEDDNADKIFVPSNPSRFDEPNNNLIDYTFSDYYTAFSGVVDIGASTMFAPRSAAPSPPPPQAGTSAWDILNLFDDSYERCELHFSSVKSDTEMDDKLPEKEIPKIAGDEKSDEKQSKNKDTDAKPKSDEDSSVSVNVIESEKKPEASEEKKLEKKEPNSDGNDGRSVVETQKDMQSLLKEASELGRQVLKLLDVAKLRYFHNHGVSEEVESSTLVHSAEEPETISSSDSVADGGRDQDGGRDSDLSSTLKKLSMWEKKLYHEVKAEGKLRVLYMQKWRELKQLGSGKSSTEARRTESIRDVIITLSAKLKIAFHVIDKVSITLSNLRDQELWPWIHGLLHGFHEMWKAMLICHSCQHKLVAEFVKSFEDGDWIQPEWNALDGDSHLEVALNLRSDLQGWSTSFANWIIIQKRFAKALNGWLSRCLLHDEPPQDEEASAPGASPSPKPDGPPSIFVICNQWSESMDAVSHKDVTDSTSAILRALEQHCVKLALQKAMADKTEQIKMEKKGSPSSKSGTYHVVPATGLGFGFASCGRISVRNEICDSSNSSLNSSLKVTFEAIEKFGATSVGIYEELWLRVQGFRDPQEIHQ